MGSQYELRRAEAIQQLITTCKTDDDGEILTVAIDALVALKEPDILRILVQLAAGSPEKSLMPLILRSYIRHTERSGTLTKIISEMSSDAIDSIISQIAIFHENGDKATSSLTAYLLDYFYYNSASAKKIAAKHIYLTSREVKYLYGLYLVPFGTLAALLMFGAQTGCLCPSNPLYPLFGIIAIVCIVLLALFVPIKNFLRWTRLFPKAIRYTVFLGIFALILSSSLYLLSLSRIFR